MKKTVAKKWVKALRSGKYKQGESYLKQFNSRGEPKYCCLGVLCELYNDTMQKKHKKTLSTKIHKTHTTSYMTFNKKQGELPNVVMKWAGIKHSCGRYTVADYVKDLSSLADMNDSGKTFKTISNFIEKNLDRL